MRDKKDHINKISIKTKLRSIGANNKVKIDSKYTKMITGFG